MFNILNFSAENAVRFDRRPQKLHIFNNPRELAENLKSPYKFAYARTALKFGLKALGFRQNESILIPDFICESAIEPLNELYIKPVYYPVNTLLEPCWEELEHLVTKSVKAIMMVHYFGQPQQILKYMDFCKKHSLKLIEDNAHGYGGSHKGRFLGTFGELGFSAPRKSFPITNGAYLHITGNGMLNLSELILKPISNKGNSGLPLWLKNFPAIRGIMTYRRKMKEYYRRKNETTSYGSQDKFRDSPIKGNYGMDKENDFFIKKQNINLIKEKRQAIYMMWQKWSIKKGLTPVFKELSVGAVPLIFPAYSNSPAESLAWYQRGQWAGIDIHSWPTLPEVIVEKNGGAMRLWEHMICFPIHQDMDINLLEKRIDLL